jgi:alpha-L-rhamnosidase
MLTATEAARVAVAAPRAEHYERPLGIGHARPRLSWTVQTTDQSWRQTAYQLRVLTADGQLRSAPAPVASAESVLVSWVGEDLRSRERVGVQVRVWSVDSDLVGDPGSASQWSPVAWMEAGLLEPADWSATPITADPVAGQVLDADADHPPVLLRRDLTVTDGLMSARLYVTACGLYEAHINGRRVGEDLLTPGWTSYHHRLNYQTYDVTGLLEPGGNAIGAYLADGWYRGSYAWTRVPNRYGQDTALLAQLELRYADGRLQTVTTDGSWTWSSGPITASHLYDGERHDARLDDPTWSRPGGGADWAPVRITNPKIGRLVAPVGPPVRRTAERAPVSVAEVEPGVHQLDFGQNLVGRLRITVTGEAGTEITIRHAEILQDGRLYTRPMRSAKATDTYILAGTGTETWEPVFTTHGFRYAEITGWPGEFDPAAATAVVVHDDMRRTGWFDCSNPLLSRLHENVLWSMRGNFVSVPTDCPQRDERLGWTGDLQVFAPTASFLYDSSGAIGDWLADVSAETDQAGNVPVYVPYIPTPSWGRFLCAVWGDVLTVVPQVLYDRFGDPQIARDNYHAARRWVDGCARLLTGHDVIADGPQLGDWLDPTAPPDYPADALTDRYLVATAYLAYSARLLADSAHRQGRTADAQRYRQLADRVTAGFRREFITPSGRLSSDAQTAYALALRFDLFETADQVQRAGDRLADLVINARSTIGTGFAGTPLVLDALADTGHLEQAYRMLLETNAPSWLYAITMGGTTIWERWDSMLPDGTVNPGEMTSFNHYALGAVADFLHRVVAGLAPATPGYRSLLVRPRPGGGLTHASASHLTPYGQAAVRWERGHGTLTVDVIVPPNTTAVIDLPGQEPSTVGSGSHQFTVPHPDPADDPIQPLPSKPKY